MDNTRPIRDIEGGCCVGLKRTSAPSNNGFRGMAKPPMSVSSFDDRLSPLYTFTCSDTTRDGAHDNEDRDGGRDHSPSNVLAGDTAQGRTCSDAPASNPTTSSFRSMLGELRA